MGDMEKQSSKKKSNSSLQEAPLLSNDSSSTLISYYEPHGLICGLRITLASDNTNSGYAILTQGLLCMLSEEQEATSPN